MERWKNIAGREGYEISDHGRVKSWVTSGTSRTGILREKPLIKVLSTCMGGYLKCGFGKRDSALIRTLVLEAFVGPRPEGLQAQCTTKSVTQCKLKYLYWGKASANISQAKLLKKEVLKIWAMLKKGIKPDIIAGIFEVTPMTINRIKRKESWAGILDGK